MTCFFAEAWDTQLQPELVFPMKFSVLKAFGIQQRGKIFFLLILSALERWKPRQQLQFLTCYLLASFSQYKT
jgi:hypothetical protein